MGQAYEIGRFLGQLAITFVAIVLVIAIIMGMITKSWLWFFGTLLVEWVVFFIIFKITDRINWVKFVKKDS